MIWVDGSSVGCFFEVERAIIEAGDKSQEGRVFDIGCLDNLGGAGVEEGMTRVGPKPASSV